jgi:hypothetical protein
MVIGNDVLRTLLRTSTLPNGILIHGPKGIGKGVIARELLARLEPQEPRADTRIITPTKSIGIDEIREAKQFLYQTPVQSPRRSCLIEDAHLMTSEAQNALLKLAEEPPNAVLLILTTHDPESILRTLRSRLTSYPAGTVPPEAIRPWLIEKGVGEKEADLYTRLAHGAPGTALRMHEDQAFRRELKKAGEFLKGTLEKRGEIAKELVAEEPFSLEAFLEAMLYLAPHNQMRPILDTLKDTSLWQVNQKLQLQALAEKLSARVS